MTGTPDANQGWDFAEAGEAALQLSDRGIEWIEEPILADGSSAEWAELAKLSASPLAGGENLQGLQAFQT